MTHKPLWRKQQSGKMSWALDHEEYISKKTCNLNQPKENFLWFLLHNFNSFHCHASLLASDEEAQSFCSTVSLKEEAVKRTTFVSQDTLFFWILTSTVGGGLAVDMTVEIVAKFLLDALIARQFGF